MHAHLVNAYPFSQQENDDIHEELPVTVSDLVEDDENPTDDAIIFAESSSLPTYAVPVLMLDNELDAKIRSLNEKNDRFSILCKVGRSHISKANLFHSPEI